MKKYVRCSIGVDMSEQLADDIGTAIEMIKSEGLVDVLVTSEEVQILKDAQNIMYFIAQYLDRRKVAYE